MNLTVAYITSREESKIDWFFQSLERQIRDMRPKIIVIDASQDKPETWNYGKFTGILLSPPKPTIWQGPHRLTKENWWAKSNAMNTAICLCETEFIAFVDDRCVLSPEWLDCVREAMGGQYAVCGRYEKWANMKVENGVIVNTGELLGMDTRPQWDRPVLTRDWYGGSCALPLEWCLEVNGFAEDMCDGMGYEDIMFGLTLRNSGLPFYYDARMRIIEDRTPTEISGALKRANKGDTLPPPRPKDWQVLQAFQHGLTTSQNSFDIRDMRARKLNGEDWRPPSANTFDWYDQQPVSEM